MTFYERFEELCAEKGYKPQSPEIISVAGVSSPAISGWKKGSSPKIDITSLPTKTYRLTKDGTLSDFASNAPVLSANPIVSGNLLIHTISAEFKPHQRKK